MAGGLRPRPAVAAVQCRGGVAGDIVCTHLQCGAHGVHAELVCVHEEVGRPSPCRARRSRRRRVGRTRTSEPSQPPPAEGLHISPVTFDVISAVTSAVTLRRDPPP